MYILFNKEIYKNVFVDQLDFLSAYTYINFIKKIFINFIHIDYIYAMFQKTIQYVINRTHHIE